jgi:hypothetical protein
MADEAVEIYNKALSLGLEMRQLPANEVRRIYNGVGAEWMGDELRAMLDKLSKTLLPAVLVHDMDYAYGNGKYIDFAEANIRLEANGRICADAEYGWYNPMRYIVRRQARLFSKLCDAFGLLAYHAAIKETKQHNKE